MGPTQNPSDFKVESELTWSFIPRIIPKLKQKDIIRLHSSFIEPPLVRIVKNFIGFVLVVGENYISWDEIFSFAGSEVT